MALHYGYCDFAQYDGVGRAKASLSSGILRLSFPKYPWAAKAHNTLRMSWPVIPEVRHDANFVIPRAVAESIFACQRSSRRSQRPWHSTMDTATSRSMTVLVGQRRLCPLASFACHSRSKRRTQTSSFRAAILPPACPAALALDYGYRRAVTVLVQRLLSSGPSQLSFLEVPAEFVIPFAQSWNAVQLRRTQAVTESAALALHSQVWQRKIAVGYATSRSMTVLVGQRRLCPLASFACHSRSKREPKLRHSARSRGIHLCLPTQ